MSDDANIHRLPRAYAVLVYFQVPADTRADSWWANYLLGSVSVAAGATAFLAGTRLQAMTPADLPPELRGKGLPQ